MIQTRTVLPTLLIILFGHLQYHSTTGLLDLAGLSVDRQIVMHLSLHNTSNDTDRTAAQLVENVLPYELVEVVYNVSGMEGTTFLEFTVSINWTGIYDPDPTDSLTPVTILMESTTVMVQGLNALSADAYNYSLNFNHSYSNNSSLLGSYTNSFNLTQNGTVTMISCSNATDYMECMFSVDLLGLVLEEEIGNSTLIQVCVPVEINYYAFDSSLLHFSILVPADGTVTGETLDTDLTLLAVQPILEMQLGEPPNEPGCPGDLRFLEVFLEHDNLSQADAYEIRIGNSGTFSLSTSPSRDRFFELHSGVEFFLVQIPLSFIQPGDHEPIVRFSYDDANRNRYEVLNTTSVFLKSYPLWDGAIDSSFSETLGHEVTMHEFFQLDMTIRVHTTYTIEISVRMCAKFYASVNPVDLVNTTLEVGGVNDIVTSTAELANPDTGCWPTGVAVPTPAPNCTCWDVDTISISPGTNPDPVLSFVFQVDPEALQGQEVQFTGSVAENLTNGSCFIFFGSEQDITVVEPSLTTTKTITLSEYNTTEPPEYQVILSVEHSPGSTGPAVGLVVSDAVPPAFSLTSYHLSRPANFQIIPGTETAILSLNESLGLGQTLVLTYTGLLHDQFYIDHSQEPFLLETVTEYENLAHDSSWSRATGYRGPSSRSYAHRQQQCVSIAALGRPRLSLLAVGAASGGAAAVSLLLCLVGCLGYGKKRKASCFGPYSSRVEPSDPMAAVGYEELEVANSWATQLQPQPRQEPEGETTQQERTASHAASSKNDIRRAAATFDSSTYAAVLAGGSALLPPPSPSPAAADGLLLRVLAVRLCEAEEQQAQLALAAAAACGVSSLAGSMPASSRGRDEAMERFVSHCQNTIKRLQQRLITVREEWRGKLSASMEEEMHRMEEEFEEKRAKICESEEMDKWGKILKEMAVLEKRRELAAKETIFVKAKRQQHVDVKEMTAQSYKSIKQCFMTTLKDVEDPSIGSTEKADVARRFGELVAIAANQLNLEKCDCQKEELEHFSKVLQFKGESEHLGWLDQSRSDHAQKHFKKAFKTLSKGDGGGSIDAGKLADLNAELTKRHDEGLKARSKACENRLDGVLQDILSERSGDQNDHVGFAPSISDIGRIRSTDDAVDSTLTDWHRHRAADERRIKAVEEDVKREMKATALDCHKMAEESLSLQKVTFTTRLLLFGIPVSKTRRLDEIYKSAMSIATDEETKQKSTLKKQLFALISHAKQLLMTERDLIRETLNFEKKAWSEEVRAYFGRPKTSQSSDSFGTHPLEMESELTTSSCQVLLEELETVWSERSSLHSRSWLVFVNDLLAILCEEDDSSEELHQKKKRLEKFLLKHKEKAKKNSSDKLRQSLQKKSQELYQKKLQAMKISLEGNSTMLAVEKARKVVELNMEQQTQEKMQFELVKNMMSKKTPPKEEVEQMLQEYNQNLQGLHSKLDQEKMRQMDHIRAKIEEKRIRKERMEAEREPSPTSPAIGYRPVPRLKQLFLKYRWEIRMEAIKNEYRARLKESSDRITSAFELKSLEAINKLDKRLTAKFAQLSHSAVSEVRTDMDPPLPTRRGMSLLPSLKEERVAIPPVQRNSAPWVTDSSHLPPVHNASALSPAPAITGRNQLPPIKIQLSDPKKS